MVGAGGIGCALGHALSAGGIGVRFIESDETKLEWGRREGVAVDDRPPQAAEFTHFERWSPSSDDLILLCIKCYDNRGVLEKVPERAKLVPVQNGFDRQLVDRVAVEGIASFVSECLPGRPHTRITRGGDLHLGPCTATGGKIPSRLDALINVLGRHGSFRVRRVTEVLPYKNAKLMYNAAISPLAAMAGLDNGELLTIPRARGLFFALLRENYRILERAGAPLARVGPVHPSTVDLILRLRPLARLLAVPFSRTLRGTYCSMAGELPQGPTELDNYNGHLLALADDEEAPLNRALCRQVERMEEERLPAELRRLEELQAALSVGHEAG